MDRQTHIDFILDHFEHPRHAGVLDAPSLAQSGTNPGCGDLVTLYLRLDGEERIAEVSFEGQGCTISQAGASLFTELVLGKTLDEATTLDEEMLVRILSPDIVLSRTGCAALALNTLRAARDKWHSGAHESLTDTGNVVSF